ncbi:MAG: GspE/PulE/PilB domain-containing protein, partial [Planctomycetota bacterium]
MATSKNTTGLAEAPKVQGTGLFGELLVSKELIAREDLVDALNEQRNNGGRLGEVLVRLKKLSEDDVTQALADYLSMEYVSFEDISTINNDVARSLPESICKRFCLIAIAEEQDKVIVAMADPLNVIAIDTITLKLKSQIKVVISSPKQIQRAIEVVYHGSDVEEQRLRDLVEFEVDSDETFEKGLDDESDDNEVDNEAAATKAPVIRFVDLLLSQAVKSRASDIHIEPQEKSMSIR